MCQTAARPRGCTAPRCSTLTHSLKRWTAECPGCRDPCVRQRLTATVRQRAIWPRCRSRIAWKNQRCRGGPLTPATHEPTRQDCPYDLAIDAMATGPSNDRPRTCAAPAGETLFRPTHPPLLTTRPAEASNDGQRTHARPPGPRTDHPMAAHARHRPKLQYISVPTRRTLSVAVERRSEVQNLHQLVRPAPESRVHCVLGQFGQE